MEILALAALPRETMITAPAARGAHAMRSKACAATVKHASRAPDGQPACEGLACFVERLEGPQSGVRAAREPN
jgi:hypothetical protein